MFSALFLPLNSLNVLFMCPCIFSVENWVNILLLLWQTQEQDELLPIQNKALSEITATSKSAQLVADTTHLHAISQLSKDNGKRDVMPAAGGNQEVETLF